MGDVYDCSPCSDSTSINKKRERRRLLLLHFLLKDNVFNGPERERNTFFLVLVCSFALQPFANFEKAKKCSFEDIEKFFDAKLL